MLNMLMWLWESFVNLLLSYFVSFRNAYRLKKYFTLNTRGLHSFIFSHLNLKQNKCMLHSFKVCNLSDIRLYSDILLK